MTHEERAKRFIEAVRGKNGRVALALLEIEFIQVDHVARMDQMNKDSATVTRVVDAELAR